MTYSIKWYNKPLKLLDSLDKKDAERILDKLDEVALDPFRYLKHYEGEGYKLRIGNFRLIIDEDKPKKILYVMIFDKREKVYNKK